MHHLSHRPSRLASTGVVVVVCLWGGSAIGFAPQEQAPGVAHVRALLERGEYAAAEREAARVATHLDLSAETPTLSQTRALDVLVETRVRNGKSGDSATLELAQRVVRVHERLGRGESLDAATSLHNLGVAHVERGEFTAAVAVHERALSIRLKQCAAMDPVIADSLEHLGLAEVLLERFTSARRRLDQALTIRQAGAGSAPLLLARALELQAIWRRYSGDYVAGLALVDEVLAIRTRAAPDFPQTTSLFDLHGDLLFLRGDIARAQQAWAAGLALAERTLDAEHPALSLFLRKLALAADAFGNRTDSRRFLDRAMKIGMPRLPPCHPEVAGLLNDSAQSAQRDGTFADARKLYQQQLRILERCHKNANWTATALHNYAGLFLEMGDLAAAERFHERAVQVWSTGLGPRHPYVARGIDSLAGVVAFRGQPSRARRLYEQALGIRRRNAQGGHPDVAWTLTNLARTWAELGNLRVALSHVDEAIAIYRQHGAADEPDHLARAFDLQGTIHTRRGSLTDARESLTAALSERERIFGPAHPLVAESRATLAQLDFMQGAADRALQAALDAEQIGRDHLRLTVRYLPERQAMAYAAKRPRALDLVLSVAASGTTSAPERALEAVIRSRGVVLDELAGRARSVDLLDPRIVSRNAAAVQARQRYANLVVRSLQELVPRSRLDQARRQKEEAEESLAERSVEARAELANAQIGLAEVRAALPPDSALISFVRYDRASVAPSGQPARWRPPVPSYAALLQRSASHQVTFVPLGTAASLDGLVNTWRDEAAGRSLVAGASRLQAERSYRAVAVRLRRAVWDPAAAHLTGVTRIFIVPDGLVNVVSIGALLDRSGRYLAEGDPVIHYLSTERDLVTPVGSAVRLGLLAVGGPAFGSRSTLTPSMAAVPLSGCGDFSRLHFSDLAGSRREVREIGAIWPTHGVGDVAQLSGAAATETAVKQAMPGRRVVHLATHGFFLGGDCAARPPGTRAVGGLALAAPKGSPTVAENPLLLAGLAFAGVNRRGSAGTRRDDGFLTAEEIAGLNLQGTEWVVLSACDTGLGEIKAGEGVLGLRRAFQIAGARTVIMSLWSVEDQSTRVWMRALYDGRLNQHLATADAVRHASLTVLRNRRARGLSTHPFYWAGFVAAGDWR